MEPEAYRFKTDNMIFHSRLSRPAAEGEWLRPTGAKDKNGESIYEGDILHWAIGPYGQQRIEVTWDQEYGRWNFLPLLSEEMEIVHESPQP